MQIHQIVRVSLLAAAFTGAFCAQAMPSRAELKKVQSAVNELMADDLAAMKGGKMKPDEVARNAEKYARESTDEASKFLFYKGAFGLYVQGSAYEEAVRALNSLTAEVKDVPDKVLAEIVRDKLKRISRKNGGAIFDLYSRIDRRIRFTGEIAALEKKVAAAPSDKALRRQLAVARVQMGAWPDALKDFAALGGKDAEAAANETKDLAAAADFWWTYPSDEEEQDAFREHAAALYRQAIASGKLSGLKLSLAKKRATEMGSDVPSTCETPVAPAAAPAEPAVAKAPVRPSAAPVQVGNLKPIVISFKEKGVRPIEFLPIPAGRVDVVSHGRGLIRPYSFAITRPFFMAKLLVDCAQWKAIMGSPSFTEDLIEGRGDPQFKGLWKMFGGSKTIAVGAKGEMLQKFLDKVNCDYRRLLPSGMIFRLPSLAEYEYAEIAGRSAEVADECHRAWGMRKLPAELAWVDEEAIRMPEYMEMLKKAGVKIPAIDPDLPGYKIRRALGRLSGPYELSSLPTGTKKPNPFGLYDIYTGARILDRLGEETRQGLEKKEYKDFLVKDLDRSVAGSEDPLFWSEKGPFVVMKRSQFNFTYPFVTEGDIGCPIRLVIGPDLVSEWKTRHKE